MHRYSVPTHLLWLALCVFGCLIPAQSIDAASCFREVPYCNAAEFDDYWRAQGGLPLFGFPISTLADEQNRDTGQRYPTQWFERNRFEAHAENAPPYDILLGRLGVDRLRQLGRDWTTFPRADPGAEHYFAETGHAIAPEFWNYWRNYGLEFGDPLISERESLALFGYPLSEPAVETNASGDTVLTQWFERARFEYHPSNPEPYRVLLGLLGTEVRQAREPSLIASTVIGRPIAAGHYILWADNRLQPTSNYPDLAAYGYDLRTRTEFLAVSTPGSHGAFATDGTSLVWVEQYLADGTLRERIQRIDLAYPQDRTVILTQDLNQLVSIAVADGVLYYSDSTPDHQGIFAHDIATGTTRRVRPTPHSNLVVRDNMLLWSESQRAGEGPGPTRSTLHAVNLGANDQELVIANVEGEFSGYDVSKGHVVWASYLGRDVHVYRLGDGTTSTIASPAGSVIFNPIIAGNLVAWTIGPGTNISEPSLLTYDISTQETRVLVRSAQLQSAVFVDGTKLVYTVPNGRASNLFMINTQ